LSKKSTGGQQKIVLMENDVILNDKKDVCDTFNSFFLLTSLVIVSVFVGLKSKSMLFFGAFFLIRSMLGWLFSSKMIKHGRHTENNATLLQN
jgi:hypothetical protein